jgi:hypothetical protein
MCGCVGAVGGGSTGGGGISLNPSSGTTNPGGALSSIVSVTRFNSTVSEIVSLSLSGCPSGSTCTLSAPNCNANPTCSVTLSITAGPNPGGPYSITITGTGATTGIIKTATYKLTISSVSCTCSDGTSCNTCSNVNKPKWCDSSGNLISNQCNAPHNCPCPAALPSCNAGTGVCSAAACTCSDGTTCGQCSTTKPKYCTSSKTLIDGCGSPYNCGCPAATPICKADGSCSSSVACTWQTSFCGDQTGCIICCYDTFGNPLYELLCGPAGCSGGGCYEGNRMCSSYACCTGPGCPE